MALCTPGATAGPSSIGPVTFDREGLEPGTPVNGLVLGQVDGEDIPPITFQFSMDGHASQAAAVRQGPGDGPYVDGYGLEGPVAGRLTIDFGQEVARFIAGVGLSATEAEADVVRVTGLAADGTASSSAVYSSYVAADGAFAGALVDFEPAAAIRGVELEVHSSGRRFLVDNLSLTTFDDPSVPVPAGPTLGPAGSTAPALLGLREGELVAAWRQDGRIFVQIRGIDGATASAVRAVSASNVDAQSPALTESPGGGFAVAWHARSSGGQEAIYLRRYSATGTPVSEEILASQVDLGKSTPPILSLASTTEDGYLVTWSHQQVSGAVRVQGPGSFPTSPPPPTVTQALDGPFESSSCAATFASMEGVALLVWCERRSDPERTVLAGRFHDAAGEPVGATMTLADGLSGKPEQPALATLPGAEALAVVVWRQSEAPNRSVVFGRTISPDGPASPVLRLQQSSSGDISEPAVALRDDGSFVAGWIESSQASGVVSRRLVARLYFGSGVPASDQFDLLSSPILDPRSAQLQWTGDVLTAAWENSSAADSAPGTYLSSFPVELEEQPCLASDERLCLRRERFRLSVQWRSFEGETGSGTGVRLTSDTGYFWFFQESAADLVVKVLDGTASNDHQWVFFGSLTNVEFDLVVEDRLTGEVRTYSNPLGHFASFGDIDAFPTPPLPGQNNHFLGTVAAQGTHPQGARPPATQPDAEIAAAWNADQTIAAEQSQLCQQAVEAEPGAVCLGDRFLVSCQWEDFALQTGQGWGQKLSDDTASFWFFEPSNLEMVIKILDARSVNDHFWVFFGSLTNVGFTLRITDLVTGEEEVWDNPSGTFASRGDVTAFSD